jgi:hypothetical protein
MLRAIGSFGIAMVLMLTATNAFADKVNWNDYVEKQPTTYTQIGKDAKLPAKAQPAQTRTVQPKANTRAVAKAPAKAAPKAKAKAPVRKK